MTGEVVAKLVQGAVMLLLAVIGGGIGWDQVKRHGAETEKRKQAERRADDAEARTERAERAPAGKIEAIALLDLLRRTRERMRRKTGRR